MDDDISGPLVLQMFIWMELNVGIFDLFSATKLTHGPQCLLEFLSPYALKNLLGYLETGSLAWNVRPWVWIILMAFGPPTEGVMLNMFLLYQVRDIRAHTISASDTHNNHSPV